MTDQNDPWAAVATQSAPASPGGGEGGNLDGAYSGDEGGSQLFNSGSVAPSLFNKTHLLGTERTGIITKAPYDRQKVNFDDKVPLFWHDEERKPKTLKEGGNPNRKVMDTFIELSTEYTMDAAEATAVKREQPYEGGERVFVVSGRDIKKFREAMADAEKRGIVIRKEADLVGKRLRVKRVGQIPNKVGNDSWDLAIRIETV